MNLKEYYGKLEERDPQGLRGVKARFLVLGLLVLTAIIMAPLLGFQFVLLPVLLIGSFALLGNCLAVLWIILGRHIQYRLYFSVFSDILCLTIAYHYLGGIEAPLIWIYAVVLIAIAAVAGVRIGIFAAVLSSVMYSSLLVGEFANIIPHVNYNFLNPNFIHEDTFYLIAKLLTDNIFFFTTAIVSGLLSERLIRSKKELEERNKEILRMQETLRKYASGLEVKVAERTEELSRTNEDMKQEIDERRQVEEALRSSEDRYQRILDSCHDMISVIDEETNLLFSNRALHENTGYSRTDIDWMDGFRTVHPDDRQRIAEWFVRVMNGEPARAVEYRGIHKSGETRWVESNADPIQWPGANKAIVNVLRDITDRKKIETQLHQASKLAAIGQLAAGVAHEINNPIATVDVQAGLVRDIIGDEARNIGGKSCVQLSECLDTIDDQIQRCRSIIENLLSFARRPATQQKTFGVNDLLQKTLTLVSRLSETKPRIDVALSEDLPDLQGDPSLLQQVFVNLLNNALKAVDEDGHIAISTQYDEDGKIRIKIKDSGPGMPADVRDRIFEPFFTTRAEGEGSGLGLSISYYIIHEMQGEMTVESDPGKGATFTVTLPLKSN